MNSTQNLPSKLKELRKKNQYSQEYVAEQLNISRQAISHWENGRAIPDIENLILLADLYNISLDELLGKEEEPDMSIKAHLVLPKNTVFMEILALAVILVLSANVPFLGIPASIIIAFWLKQSKRNYKIIYALCLVCLVIGIHDVCTVLVHINMNHGGATIEPIS